MQEKLIGALMILAVVVGVGFGANFLQRERIRTVLNEHLVPSNAHTFRDRNALENRLLDDIIEVVGEDASPEIEMYHFVGYIDRAGVHVDELPKYGGIQVDSARVQISALLCRVWWTQTLFGQRPRDVNVVKYVLVDGSKLGNAYSSPPDDFAEVQDPTLLLESDR